MFNFFIKLALFLVLAVFIPSVIALKASEVAAKLTAERMIEPHLNKILNTHKGY